MTPGKRAETQEQANKASALVQRFWRNTAYDYAELIGKEGVQQEDTTVALNFSNAKSSIEELEKKIKANAKKPKESK